MQADQRAFLVSTIATLLASRKYVAVGANLPIPAAAALLARHLSGSALRVEILGSRKFSLCTGLGDFFNFASQGRFDGFFLSPGQIDGGGNINLVGVGAYPRLDVRWPGSHGAPLLYMMIPNIILFRERHLKRALVPKVDFISAPGTSASNIHRPGGPCALVTGMGVFSFDRQVGRFHLRTIHPGHDLAGIRANTGFSFDCEPTLRTTRLPDARTLDLIERRVGEEVAEIYPQFAESLALSAGALRALRVELDDQGSRPQPCVGGRV